MQGSDVEFVVVGREDVGVGVEVFGEWGGFVDADEDGAGGGDTRGVDYGGGGGGDFDVGDGCMGGFGRG